MLVSFVENLRERGHDLYFSGAVSEEEVVAAEQGLQLGFPADYREFLLRWGCGNIDSVEIFGLGVEPVGVPSVIWLTTRLRDKYGLPDHVGPIEDLGDGAYAVLTTLQSEYYAYTSGVVALWTPNAEGLQKLATSFTDYLVDKFGETRG